MKTLITITLVASMFFVCNLFAETRPANVPNYSGQHVVTKQEPSLGAKPGPIERTFFGFKLGEDSRQTVVAKLKALGYKISSSDKTDSGVEAIYMFDQKSKYENIVWDSFAVTFYKGTVYSFELTKVCKTEQSAHHMYERLYYALGDRYGHLRKTTADYDYLLYEDDDTYVEMRPIWSCITMRFTDTRIENKSMKF